MRTPDQSLLARILETPLLAQLVPHLQPEVLHRVIESCGLEDCGELVALATPGQLAGVFDLDLWHAGRPGRHERLDADRFGLWLEVLVESGAGGAARTLAEMDVELMIAALSQHARVFDVATLLPGVPIDAERTCDVGGYRVVALRTGSWDAIVAVLVALGDEHQEYFHAVMRGCRSLSNAGREVDGLDDLLDVPEQVMFDVARERERRREQQGYATPEAARAFLQLARQTRLEDQAGPEANPVARAYFRDIDWSPAGISSTEVPAEAAAAFADVLIEEGVLPPQPRALLDGPQGQAPRLARIQAHMLAARERDQIEYAKRSEELAYLANTIVTGCVIQARPLSAQEASEAAVAVCNLGLEHWPPRWPAAGDLVAVFQVGWTVLYQQVCLYSAETLIRVLRGVRGHDREIQAGINALRIALTKHVKAGAPWRARDAMDVIMILDAPAWAALLGLIDQCPVLHAGLAASRGSRTRSVDPSAFEFISQDSQIASVHEFLQRLPDALRA